MLIFAFSFGDFKDDASSEKRWNDHISDTWKNNIYQEFKRIGKIIEIQIQIQIEIDIMNINILLLTNRLKIL